MPPMAAGFGEMPGSFVVIFFRTKAGELHCRVTDVATRETWVVRRAADLRQLLVERRSLGPGGVSRP
jgi:hypothetical protein